MTQGVHHLATNTRLDEPAVVGDEQKKFLSDLEDVIARLQAIHDDLTSK